MHEKLQVNTALVSGHGHDGVRLPLVALIEQLGDKPNMKARCSLEEAWTPACAPHLSRWQASITVRPRSPLHFPGVCSLACWGSPITGHPSPSYAEPKGRIWGTLPAEQGGSFLHSRAERFVGLSECVDSHTGRRGAELSGTITILLAKPCVFPLWRLGH